MQISKSRNRIYRLLYGGLVAILLMVLGLMVAFHGFGKLVGSKQDSSKTAAE